MKKKKINDLPVSYHHKQRTLTNAQRTKRGASSVAVSCLVLIVGAFLTGYTNIALMGLLMVVMAASAGIAFVAREKPNARVSQRADFRYDNQPSLLKRLYKWLSG